MAQDVVVNYKFNSDSSQVRKSTLDLNAVGKAAGVAFAAITAGATASTVAFAKFDNQIRGVKTLLDETSFGAQGLEKGFSQMRKEILNVGATSGQSLETLNKALFDTVSAGVPAAKAVETVGVASKLAVAGLTDVSIATDGITSALGAYGKEAGDANAISAKFFTAQKFGKTTIEELAGGLGLVVTSAESAGVSFEELLGATASLTTAGIRTNAAFTGIKAAISNVAKPTEDATKEAKRLGIEFNAAALRTKGLEGFLKDLANANGFTEDSVTKLFGSVEAQKVAFALTGNQAESFSRNIKELSDSQKAAATFTDAYTTQNASLSRQFEILKGTLSVVLVEIGEKFEPIVLAATQAITKFIQEFRDTGGIDKFADSIVSGISIAKDTIGGLTPVIKLLVSSLIILKAQAVVNSNAFKNFSNGVRGLGASLVKGLASVKSMGLSLKTLAISAKSGNISFKSLAVGVKGFVVSLKTARAAIKLFKVALTFGLSLVLDEIIGAVIEFRERLGSWTNVFKLVGVQIKIFFQSILLKALEVNDSLLSLASAFGLGGKAAESNAKAIDQLKNNISELNKEKQSLLDTDKKAEEQKKKEEQREPSSDGGDLGTGDKSNAEKIAENGGEEAAVRQRLFEERLEQDEEFRNALGEIELEQEEIAALKLQTKEEQERETRKALAKQRIDDEKKANDKFLKDKIQFGTTIATVERALNDQRVQGVKQGTSQLAQLQQSENSTLKGIGKVSALTQLALNAPITASNIYKGFSAIPIIGPALGIAAAGASLAFNAEQASKIIKAQSGGVVPQVFPGLGDRQPALLEAGETVVPRQNFDELINSVANQRITQGDLNEGEDRPAQMVEIGFNGDEAEKVLTSSQNEARALGISEEIA